MHIDMRKQIAEWAESTNWIYHELASGPHGNHLSFYTQSPLNNIGDKPVDVMIIGINPGSEGSYEDMLCDRRWTGTDARMERMPASHLLLDNHCWNEALHCTSWDLHLTWKYFQNLMGYLSAVEGYEKNILLDEERFVLTNLTFFNTKNVQSLPRDIQQKSFGCSIRLIEIIKPGMVIFLGVEECRKLLGTIEDFEENTAAMEVLERYPKIGSGVYVGSIVNIPCVTVRHPAYSTNEEATFIKAFLRETFARDIRDAQRWHAICRRCQDAVKYIVTTKRLRRRFGELYPSADVLTWVYLQDVLVTEVLLTTDQRGNYVRKVAQDGNVAMDLIPVAEERGRYDECRYRLVAFFRHQDPSVRRQQAERIARCLGMEFTPWSENEERHVLGEFPLCSDADISSMAEKLHHLCSTLIREFR